MTKASINIFIRLSSRIQIRRDLADEEMLLIEDPVYIRSELFHASSDLQKHIVGIQRTRSDVNPCSGQIHFSMLEPLLLVVPSLPRPWKLRAPIEPLDMRPGSYCTDLRKTIYRRPGIPR
jgi:hypothetical protein